MEETRKVLNAWATDLKRTGRQELKCKCLKTKIGILPWQGILMQVCYYFLVTEDDKNVKLQCKSLLFASIVHDFSVLLLLLNRTLICLLIIAIENTGFTSVNRKMSRHDEKMLLFTVSEIATKLTARFCCWFPERNPLSLFYQENHLSLPCT